MNTLSRRVAAMALLAHGLACARAAQSAASDPPEALRKMYESRAAIHTARIECSSESNAAGRRLFRYFTVQLAGEKRLRVNRGDEEGVLVRTESGAAAPQRGALRHFSDGHASYELSELNTSDKHIPIIKSAKVMTEGRPVVPEFRALGLRCGWQQPDLYDAVFRDRVSQPSPRSYTVRTEGALHHVTARTDAGEIRWTIDAERGWNPTRVEQWRDGKLVAKSIITLKQFDDVWFPETVQDYRDGDEPIATVQVTQAEFNRPAHPATLGPGDIGIEQGDVLTRVDNDRRELAAGFFDGSRFVPADEYRAARQAQREADAAGGDAGAANAGARPGTSSERWESEWEKYTRQFIERFALDDGQQQAAMTILKACQEKASAYLRRQGDALTEVAAKLDEARAAGSAAAMKEWGERKARLLQPIDDIFEGQLKPRLDKLPTRAQREAAAATTRPADRNP